MAFKKQFFWISLIVLAVLLTLLAISDWDYTASIALGNENSIWAEFFNRFGELPATIGLLLATTILYGGRKRDVAWKNLVSSIFGILFMLVFSYFIIMQPINYAFEEAVDGTPQIWTILNIVLALILFAGALLWTLKTEPEKFRKWKSEALVLLILVISEMILVNVVKIVWARPRMRSITSIEEFKHWFEISGPSNDNELKSFPSGHTGNAMVILAYGMFISKLKPNWFKPFVVFAILWTVLVMVSRVVLGAHFLSDVLVGAYITLFLFALWQSVFLKKHAKE